MAFAQVVIGQTIRCSVLYKSGENIPIDPDGWYDGLTGSPVDSTVGEPYAQIYDENEALQVFVPASTVSKKETGLFYFDYVVPVIASIGIYRIRWYAYVSQVPIIYDDYFKVTATPTATSDTLITRIKRELKDLSTELDDLEYADAQMDSEGDVMPVSALGLAWHNQWEILWLTKRGVRHCLQRILNNWLTKFSIGKAGKSLSLSDPSRAIMQRIDQIDQTWNNARKDHWFDGVHWIFRPEQSAITSVSVPMGYRVDTWTGADHTLYYDSHGHLVDAYYDEDPWL
jgi:hypothetical protein